MPPGISAERHRSLAVLVAILIVFHAASSVRAFPNYIPYANELWGGPARTHEILADSNVDWGQGLVALKQYIDRHQVQNCWFAYFGQLIVDVSYYGIPCKALPTAFADLIQAAMPVLPPQVDGPVFISATEITRTYWRADWVNRLAGPILDRVARLRPVAAEAGLSLAQLAVAWVLQNPAVSAAIIGASRPEQVRENVRASGVRLDPALLQQIDDILGPEIRRDPALTASPAHRP